jgi:hypothetical protein
LKLVYLYRSIRLEFEVSISDSTRKSDYRIRFVADRYNQSLDYNFEAQLQTLCNNTSAKTSTSSLYSTVSKLLSELQNFGCQPKLRAPPYLHHAHRLFQHRTTTWDLPLFLMRCAATSGNSSKLCTPFPYQDGTDNNNNSNNNNKNPPHPAFTLRFIRDNLLSLLQIPTKHKRQQRRQQQNTIHPTFDEQAMMEFLSCLQWTEDVQICWNDDDDDVDNASGGTSTNADNKKTKNSSDNNRCNSKSLRATLHLNRDALPRFQKQDQHDPSIIKKAYHGTSIENAWSILNYGLRQHPSLQKNGELMGPGVYLSSKYDVAYFFATQNGSAKYLPTEIWKQSPCFWRLIGSTKSSTRSRQVMDHSHKIGLDLLCYVVVECTIYKATSISDNNQPEASIQQVDTYFVVKSPYNIHMDRIYLTFEFHQQPRWGKWTVMWWMMVAAAVLLIWNVSCFLNATNDDSFSSSHLDYL